MAIPTSLSHRILQIDTEISSRVSCPESVYSVILHKLFTDNPVTYRDHGVCLLSVVLFFFFFFFFLCV